MAGINDEGILLLNQALDTIALNKPYTALTPEDMSDGLSELAAQVNKIAENIRQLNAFLIDLANGKLNIIPPPRSNYMAAGAKMLHSHLNHLTWQTQQIAKGDYKQTVDFMGDFAAAFNTLTKQLSEREQSLKTHNEIMRTVFDHVECLFILNAENRHEAFYINKSAQSTFHLASESLDLLESSKHSDFINQLLGMELGEDSSYEILDFDTKQWYNIIVSPMQWLENKPALLFYCMNISSHKEREATLEKDAYTDPLTGINNRRALDYHLKKELQYAKRLNVYISLFIIDIDFFKRYNDTFGHIQGDACLMAVAKCIHSTMSRLTDFVARFGGEEFIAVSLNVDPASAMKLGEKIRLAVESLKIINTSNPSEITSVTISIGVCSVIPSLQTAPTHLIRMADGALYQSKESGRNRVTLAET